MPWRPALLLVVAALLLYGRTATFGFVQADDLDLIAGNQAFLRDLTRLPEAFARSYFQTEQDTGTLETYYRPVAIASLMLDAQRAGADPGPYHATNVVLHAAVVLALWRLLIALGTSRQAALLSSLLFAVHPANAQAVAWIAGRNELLFGLFTLLAVRAFVGVIDTGAVRWLALHVAAFALALFSKETALAIPLALFMLWRLSERRGRRWPWPALAVGDAAVLVVWYILRASALAGSSATTAAPSDVLHNLPHLLVHLGKLIAPLRLNVMPGADAFSLTLGVIAVAVCAASARLIPWRLAATGYGWLLLFLAPGLLVPDLPAYEHRMYVPMAGAALVLAAVLSRATRPGPARAASAVAVVFAVQALLHSSVFRDPLTYWQNGTRSARHAPIAHVNLGQLREQAGDLTGAQDEYRRALALDPATPKAHNNLGVVLMRLDRPGPAVELFREEVRRYPQNADAWFNLGLWAEMQGDAAEARRMYQRALQENPAFRPAAEKLGGAVP